MDTTLQQLLQTLIDYTRENQELKMVNKGLVDKIQKLMKETEQAAKSSVEEK
jgi:hypothetical protein